MVAKIRVTGPDGAICGIYFTTALRNLGSCSGCGKERLLRGKATDGTDICRVTTHMTCEGCATETERFRAGHCIRCVLRTDLEALLHPHTPPDLSLKRLIGVLAAAARPESVYTWMRGANANELLTSLGTRSIALTHESFDALPASRSVEYLREMLVHHGMLPDRDRQSRRQSNGSPAGTTSNASAQWQAQEGTVPYPSRLPASPSLAINCVL